MWDKAQALDFILCNMLANVEHDGTRVFILGDDRTTDVMIRATIADTDDDGTCTAHFNILSVSVLT